MGIECYYNYLGKFVSCGYLTAFPVHALIILFICSLIFGIGIGFIICILFKSKIYKIIFKSGGENDKRYSTRKN